MTASLPLMPQVEHMWSRAAGDGLYGRKSLQSAGLKGTPVKWRSWKWSTPFWLFLVTRPLHCHCTFRSCLSYCKLASLQDRGVSPGDIFLVQKAAEVLETRLQLHSIQCLCGETQ